MTGGTINTTAFILSRTEKVRTRRNDAASHPDLFSFPLTQHKPHNIRTTMRLNIGDILEYNGLCLTCTDVNFTTPNGSVGEDTLEYTFENDFSMTTFRDDQVSGFMADGATVSRV